MADMRDWVRRNKIAWPMRLCDGIDRKNRPHEMEHVKSIVIRELNRMKIVEEEKW